MGASKAHVGTLGALSLDQTQLNERGVFFMPMTIDKAIEILQEILIYVKSSDSPDDYGAIQLSIEALKAVKWSREQKGPFFISSIPGETEA